MNQPTADNQVAVVNEDRPGANVVISDQAWMDAGQFAHLQRVAKLFSSSSLVPEHFKSEGGKDPGKVANCTIALQMAARMRMDPMLVLQNLYVVAGRPGMSATFAIALAQQAGVFKGAIRYETKGVGDALSVRAHAVDAATGEVVESTVTMAEAIADGWTKNPKYKSMPGLMLSYRSAMRLIRLSYPQVLFGMQSREELETMPSDEYEAAKPTARDALKAALAPVAVATTEHSSEPI